MTPKFIIEVDPVKLPTIREAGSPGAARFTLSGFDSDGCRVEITASSPVGIPGFPASTAPSRLPELGDYRYTLPFEAVEWVM